MARAGAGNSRGLSGWRSPSGARGPAFLLPGPGGGVRRREGLAARVGGGAAAASAAEPRGRRRPLLRSRPASREPLSAPARGPRPLAVPASFPHTPPGPPGPQAFPALLLPLSKLRCEPAAAAVRLPRCLRGDFSSSGSPFTHRHTLAHTDTHTGARARSGSLGRPLFSSPAHPHPHNPLNAAVGGGRRIDVPSASCSRRRGR